MRILVQNLGGLPYALDLGEFDDGMVRPNLAPAGASGDTVNIGDRVDPWTLNTDGRLVGMRRLVVPDSSTRVVTAVAGGYSVTATPPGQLKVTFIGEDNDLVFLISVVFAGPPAKGSILVGNGTSWVEQPVGPDGYVLTADSAQSDGVSWQPGGSGSGLPPATRIGQVLYSVNGTTFVRALPITTQQGWLVNNFGLLLVKP